MSCTFMRDQRGKQEPKQNLCFPVDELQMCCPLCLCLVWQCMVKSNGSGSDCSSSNLYSVSFSLGTLLNFSDTQFLQHLSRNNTYLRVVLESLKGDQ